MCSTHTITTICSRYAPSIERRSSLKACYKTIISLQVKGQREGPAAKVVSNWYEMPKVRRTTTTPRKIIRLDVAALSLVQWKVQMATNHQMCVRFMQERPYINAHSEAHPLNQAGLSPEAKVYYYMALNFKNLKDPKLGLTDKLTFGKFKDCRLCDIIEDHYEYLIWVEKEGYVKFQQDVTNLILEQAHFEKWVEPVEVKPKVGYSGLAIWSRIRYTFDDMDDDIPF